MSQSTSRSSLEKRSFYSRPEISEAYDRQRFGGPSGTRVNEREIALVLDMLPPSGRVLDLACGTGRVSRAVAARGQAVVGVDYSPPMAARTGAFGVPTVVADAFDAPFPAQCFERVVSLRFAFHYPDLYGLLAEMRRLTTPGGTLVFDTYNWTPRSIVALGAPAWGGRVYVHSRSEVAREAAALGLRIERIEPCFLFSPYLYRLAPLPLERFLESIEPRVPRGWLCRVFWKLTRP